MPSAWTLDMPHGVRVVDRKPGVSVKLVASRAMTMPSPMQRYSASSSHADAFSSSDDDDDAAADPEAERERERAGLDAAAADFTFLIEHLPSDHHQHHHHAHDAHVARAVTFIAPGKPRIIHVHAFAPVPDFLTTVTTAATGMTATAPPHHPASRKKPLALSRTRTRPRRRARDSRDVDRLFRGRSWIARALRAAEDSDDDDASASAAAAAAVRPQSIPPPFDHRWTLASSSSGSASASDALLAPDPSSVPTTTITTTTTLHAYPVAVPRPRATHRRIRGVAHSFFSAATRTPSLRQSVC
ncbi:MAG: hypothetical protein M1826_005958 [Phylliscum demangeonii]|nr:MAG: hypothetical protein M1826_005958 [Phylliscum demangeonii]